MVDFDQLFKQATATLKEPRGYEPLTWQRRLFDRFCRNDIPKIVNLPTGLGKTSVIHIWLLALRHQTFAGETPHLPTRLVYVVDRRTVVDQATEVAEGIKRNFKSLGLGQDWLAVSTLRGQLADNREWTLNPSRPAIIIGTVDMIGSRLLFSGYRSSYKRRPLEAGLLGRDALIILDEAHLSEPFATLTRRVEDWNPGSLFVIHMSATGTNGAGDPFELVPSDLEGDRDSNPVVRRYESEKGLIIHEGVTDLYGTMANAALKLASDHARVVIFVRSPHAATRIAGAIRAKEKPFATLTGTMRGWERDKLLDPKRASEQPEGRILQRFLDPVNRPEEGPAILVSTSAGEVGFDLNADHLVCDAAPLDSMIQRLGRVNRRGDGRAEAHLFAEKPKDAPQKQGGRNTTSRQTIEAVSAEAVAALKHLPKVACGSAYDASPKSFAALGKPEHTLSPKPATVEVTDILLDAWSTTSITKPMPGRPAVAPWLRGIDDDLPQTTIAWRAELDLFKDKEVDNALKAIEAVFQKHHIRPHETLTIRTDSVVEFLKKSVKERPSLEKQQVLLMTGELTPKTIRELIDDPAPLRADPTLILPASFGGLDDSGMLNEKWVAAEPAPDVSTAPRSLDVADEPGYERESTDVPRLRLLLVRVENTWVVIAMPGATLDQSLSGITGEPADLIETIKAKSGRNLRVRQPLEVDKEGNVTQYLLSLYPARARQPASKQPLDEHVRAVESCAARIAEGLQLEEPYLSALKFAAKHHDEGKKARTWQYAVGNRDLHQPLGKSGGRMNVKRLGGYRHEFGSLLRITDSVNQATIELPSDPESRDLALHLIAVHHGSGRPHFARPIDVDYDDRKRCPQMAAESIRRFARLQRLYGHWRLAWLENLLRCADAMASAENEEEET